MSLTVTLSGLSAADLAAFTGQVQNRAGMHARMAGDAEILIKRRGKATAATEHRTANALGATPTGHLADAYEGIEGESSADAAVLLVPGASRLRAAFGRYVLTPRNGSKYLTIPANAEAYGKRAREIGNLFPVRVGPRKTLTLSRQREGGGLEVMYVLVQRAEIPEDAGLIPFDDLAQEAADSAEAFIDESIQAHLS